MLRHLHNFIVPMFLVRNFHQKIIQLLKPLWLRITIEFYQLYFLFISLSHYYLYYEEVLHFVNYFHDLRFARNPLLFLFIWYYLVLCWKKLLKQTTQKPGRLYFRAGYEFHLFHFLCQINQKNLKTIQRLMKHYPMWLVPFQFRFCL